MTSCNLSTGVSIVARNPPAGSILTIDPMLLLTGHAWKGTMLGGWKMRDAVPKLVSSYLEKKFSLDVLNTHTLPFAKLEEGLELLRAGKSIRTVLLF